MSTTFEIVRDNLTITIEAGKSLVPADLTMKFRRIQGPQAGPTGREFSVSGPKADVVRALIFADQKLTRKQIAELAKCSVSRVSEVVWGLEYDRVEFPEIPLREAKPEVVVEKPAVTPEDDSNPAIDLAALLSASIAERKAEQATNDELGSE